MKNDDIAMTGNARQALLICPAEQTAPRFLAQARPFSNLSALGQPLVVRWLEHLASIGARQVRILASDRVEQIRAVVGNGSRWGLAVEVIAEDQELTADEARAKYRAAPETGSANDVILMDHFPGLREYPLFKSYAHWFNGLRALFAHGSPAVGDVREIKPGVWASARARISPRAELRAPCWIGPHTVVAADTVIGPMAILEERVMVESGVEIANSAVAPETFVGRLTELKDCLAEGSILVNWRTGSCAQVPDARLLCALGKRKTGLKPTHLLARALAALAMLVTLPVGVFGMLWAKIRHQPALRALTAVRPLPSGKGALATVTYYELGAGLSGLRAWPQLWSVVRGDFAWVGNRPLSPAEVGELGSDFERLWLAAPIGLISMAQAEGAKDGPETRLWASLYAARANWRLDLSILGRAFFVATVRSFTALF